MLKYTDIEVTFAEVPDEITLCINISNCPCHCKGCHSVYLAEDIGTWLTHAQIDSAITSNRGITCVCFMGGDAEPGEVNSWAEYIREHYPFLGVAWYSGRQELSEAINLMNFDYIKLGPYKEECGPLSSKTTNQRFYQVLHTNEVELVDITKRFWREDD